MQNGLQLFELLDTCRDRVLQHEYLSTVTVITENQGDLVTTINTALAKLGVVIVLGDVEARNKRLNAPKPVWWPITFTAMVTESPLLNRGGSGSDKPAQVVADKVAEQLHHFVCEWGTVVAVAIRPLNSKKYNVYEIECQIGE